uniref:Uncharacterized protein n=1 Tax=Chromera velia CCMP2878 TaxID=1169474 RepID=A0A0G4G488_9ALVE|eukprot:Cvel_20130.t1-p1 / transcript=Cvel_20130.t1 / gene=Cvel_20130 / organism=Chromera_velia_CCMP2878 / gene_product=hypothetical protein / transcript_product=hypothetical protein / location=Cvel_scaffold1785:21738-24005(-) / protein_length=756 / sequence_SO=supercontig / SO=protein_coding / is_pseudo=false
MSADPRASALLEDFFASVEDKPEEPRSSSSSPSSSNLPVSQQSFDGEPVLHETRDGGHDLPLPVRSSAKSDPAADPSAGPAVPPAPPPEEPNIIDEENLIDALDDIEEFQPGQFSDKQRETLSQMGVVGAIGGFPSVGLTARLSAAAPSAAQSGAAAGAGWASQTDERGGASEGAQAHDERKGERKEEKGERARREEQEEGGEEESAKSSKEKPRAHLSTQDAQTHPSNPLPHLPFSVAQTGLPEREGGEDTALDLSLRDQEHEHQQRTEQPGHASSCSASAIVASAGRWDPNLPKRTNETVYVSVISEGSAATCNTDRLGRDWGRVGETQGVERGGSIGGKRAGERNTQQQKQPAAAAAAAAASSSTAGDRETQEKEHPPAAAAAASSSAQSRPAPAAARWERSTSPNLIQALIPTNMSWNWAAPGGGQWDVSVKPMGGESRQEVFCVSAFGEKSAKETARKYAMTHHRPRADPPSDDDTRQVDGGAHGKKRKGEKKERSGEKNENVPKTKGEESGKGRDRGGGVKLGGDAENSHGGGSNRAVNRQRRQAAGRSSSPSPPSPSPSKPSRGAGREVKRGRKGGGEIQKGRGIKRGGGKSVSDEEEGEADVAHPGEKETQVSRGRKTKKTRTTHEESEKNGEETVVEGEEDSETEGVRLMWNEFFKSWRVIMVLSSEAKFNHLFDVAVYKPKRARKEGEKCLELMEEMYRKRQTDLDEVRQTVHDRFPIPNPPFDKDEGEEEGKAKAEEEGEAKAPE